MVGRMCLCALHVCAQIEQEVARLEEIDGGNSALTEDIDDDTKVAPPPT